jgi:hypothetical protein
MSSALPAKLRPKGNPGLLLCFLLAGCHAWGTGYDNAREPGGRAVVYSYDPVVAGLVVAVLLIDGMRYYVYRDGTRVPAPLESAPAAQPDPSRAVSVQDCTTPVDPTQGNLVCR